MTTSTRIVTKPSPLMPAMNPPLSRVSSEIDSQPGSVMNSLCTGMYLTLPTLLVLSGCDSPRRVSLYRERFSLMENHLSMEPWCLCLNLVGSRMALLMKRRLLVDLLRPPRWRFDWQTPHRNPGRSSNQQHFAQMARPQEIFRPKDVRTNSGMDGPTDSVVIDLTWKGSPPEKPYIESR